MEYTTDRSMKFFFFLIAQKHELSQEETKLGTNNKKTSEEVKQNWVLIIKKKQVKKLA